jgi:Phosphodiester glycosidase
VEQRRQQRAEAKRKRRRRRIFGTVAALFLLFFPAAVYSYVAYLTRPTSVSWDVNSVEWVRHKVPFGNWIMDQVEHTYYSANAPKKGGPQLKRLPKPGGGLSAIAGAAARAWPPKIQPVFPNPLPGEGVWRPIGPPVNGGPPVLLTTFRTELAYPAIVAYVAWFDHTRTAVGYYPGRYEPPNAAVRGPMSVPQSQRYRLLTTFNGGFTATDGNNGSTDNGQVNEPLTDGNATLVGYSDGRIDIVKWSGGTNAGPGVAWARQSLKPIVWNGQLNPDLNDNPDSPEWGYSLGSVVRVWRTGVGVDRRGNLFYVAANDQTVITLAKILQHIGAVKAMEFDINPEWHTLITYSHGAGGLVPKKVEPQDQQSSNRYLVPDDRDFFAVYSRQPGPVTVPFN